MDESLARWLALREPADAAARSDALTRAIAGTWPAGDPIRVLDLATGAGSNIRFLMERLPGRQQWLAVDRSATLLAALRERMSSWGTARGYEVQITGDVCVVRGAALECHIETRQRNLGTLDDGGMFDRRHLVTASALLDLVSDEWLQSLAAQCRAARAAALFTITYNGRSFCEPAEPEDEMVRDLLNQHQRTDKGLGGAAAGPAAVARANQRFSAAGYRVEQAPSAWTLTPAMHQMQRMLIDGWADAATELAPGNRTQIADWHARRLAHLEGGRSHIAVGHDDLAAWLP